MNPQIESEKHLEMENDLETVATEQELLAQAGFTPEETVSLLWLRQWYQHGGSDRIEVIRNLEFVKLLYVNGKLES